MLVTRFHEVLCQQHVLYGDETPYRVIESENERTYYWVYSTLKSIATPVVIYDFQESRARCVLKEFLKGFNGYIHCDGFSVYDNLPGILPVRCLAHIRRKLYEAIPKKQRDSDHPAVPVVKEIDKLFALERKWQPLEPEERLAKRQKEMRADFNRVFEMIDDISKAPKSKLAIAVNYARTC